MEHAFQPTLLWAIALLPLLGFVINGVIAFVAPQRKNLITLLGPGVVGLAFVMELGFLGGRGKLGEREVVSLVEY